MSDDNTDDLFDEDLGKSLEWQAQLKHLAAIVIPMYRIFTLSGLPPQEAAALTAAMVAQNVPIPGVGPQEGS